MSRHGRLGSAVALLFAGLILTGCARDSDMDFLKEHDRWIASADYVPEVRRVVEARGFCLSLDIRGRDFVFSRTAQRTKGDEAAVLAAAGLLLPIATTPELQFAQKGEPGDWYRITELGRKYHRGGGSWCFGRRVDIAITNTGTPRRNKFGTIQRTISYSYRAADMPDFTQTAEFHKLFPKAPANGAVVTDSIKLVFGWKGSWELPSQPIET